MVIFRQVAARAGAPIPLPDLTVCRHGTRDALPLVVLVACNMFWIKDIRTIE